MRVRVSDDRRSFRRDGRPWFYLADTAWSAMTNPTDDEWRRYLDVRAEQGFTAIQVNLLPQWDRSRTPIHVQPFAESGKRYDFSRPQDGYFQLVSRRLGEVTQRGMVPVAVLLWCNYVPDTWASERMPDHVIPEDALESYLRLALDAAAAHEPVYMISGDTDFQTPRAVAYYRTALRVAKETDPEGLTTLHLAGARSDIPADLREMAELDFYTFQSGHGPDTWPQGPQLAQAFRSMQPVRPVVNAEPCYEGHGIGHSEGRFGAPEVRQAAWQSLLAGANAGVAYGAHGIWSWHREGAPFPSTEFSGVPFRWEDALAFPGAADYAYVERLARDLDLFSLEPSPLPGLPSSAVAARSGKGRRIVYLPYAYDLPLSEELAALRWHRIDLQTRTVLTPRVISIEGVPHLAKGPLNGDSLLVGEP